MALSPAVMSSMIMISHSSLPRVYSGPLTWDIGPAVLPLKVIEKAVAAMSMMAVHYKDSQRAVTLLPPLPQARLITLQAFIKIMLTFSRNSLRNLKIHSKVTNSGEMENLSPRPRLMRRPFLRSCHEAPSQNQT
mgnify:CR=1 FL=1